MTREELSTLYRGYIACLNAQDWASLGRFVADDVEHNGRPFDLSGYRSMLENDFASIPDLRFQIDLLVAEPPHIACRLAFDCTPRGRFFDLPIDGRRVSFAENVFYEFAGSKIVRVWSVIDKLAIEAQLRNSPLPGAA